MLLNVVKGPRSYEEISIVNGVVYATYKEACNALELLENDSEWYNAIVEASDWSSGRELQELFVTILVFCEFVEPSNLWDSNWKILCEDILHQQRRLLQCDSINLTDDQLRNHGLYEIAKLLQQLGKSISDFPQMPQPNMLLVSCASNLLIEEELNYDTSSLVDEHHRLFVGLNAKQVIIFESIMNSVSSGAGGLFFIYGHGGTGKTYIYNTLLSGIRSQGKIALAAASSGIAALLLPGGRTTHSRFIDDATK